MAFGFYEAYEKHYLMKVDDQIRRKKKCASIIAFVRIYMQRNIFKNQFEIDDRLFLFISKML